MNIFSTLVSKAGCKTTIGFDFESTFDHLVQTGDVDSFIVSCEDGFSPLGNARGFFAKEIGLSEREISKLAEMIRVKPNRVSLFGINPGPKGSLLRGIILAPGETSTC